MYRWLEDAQIQIKMPHSPGSLKSWVEHSWPRLNHATPTQPCDHIHMMSVLPCLLSMLVNTLFCASVWSPGTHVNLSQKSKHKMKASHSWNLHPQHTNSIYVFTVYVHKNTMIVSTQIRMHSTVNCTATVHCIVAVWTPPNTQCEFCGCHLSPVTIHACWQLQTQVVAHFPCTLDQTSTLKYTWEHPKTKSTDQLIEGKESYVSIVSEHTTPNLEQTLCFVLLSKYYPHMIHSPSCGERTI